jgi:hypothetical protein
VEGESPRAASSSPRALAIESRGIDIAEAKKGLSLFYRVPADKIEIVIRG